MRLVRLLIALLLFVALVSFARAEDAAPEATPEGAQDAAPLVDEGTESVMIIDTTEAPAEVTEAAPEATPFPLSESDKVTFSWTVVSQLTLTVVVSFLAGGLTVGGGILLVLRTILKSHVLSDMVEKLWLSQPIERQQQQRGIIAGIKEVAEGISTLTDGKLAESDAVG